MIARCSVKGQCGEAARGGGGSDPTRGRGSRITSQLQIHPSCDTSARQHPFLSFELKWLSPSLSLALPPTWTWNTDWIFPALVSAALECWRLGAKWDCIQGAGGGEADLKATARLHF